LLNEPFVLREIGGLDSGGDAMLLAESNEVFIQRAEGDETDGTGLLALVVIVTVDESFSGAVCEDGTDGDVVFHIVSFLFTIQIYKKIST
jgi:hypothetical protein